jgi:hypothetical protein
MKKKHKKAQFQVMLVSYVPLLMGEAGRSDLDPKEVSKLVDEAPSGTALACVWLKDNEDAGVHPCFIMDDAQNIAEHLKLWAEGEPDKWFVLTAAEHGGLYGLALMPRFDKGIERFRIAYQLRNGLPIPKDASVTLLFKPLHFLSKPGHMFEKVKLQLGNRIKLSLIDNSMVDTSNPASAPWDKAISLGEFEFAMQGPECNYVVAQLKNKD